VIAAAPPPGRGRGFIVEFVGLPGAGKSTVSHAAATALRDDGRPVTERSFEIAHRIGGVARRLTKLLLVARLLLRRPGPALALLAGVARIRQRDRFQGLVKTLDLIAVCGLIADLSRRPGIHLLDQGFFGGLWSIGFGAVAGAPLGPLIAAGSRCCGTPPADLVVILDVPTAVVVDRLKQRPGAASRLERSLTTAARDQDLLAAIASLGQVRGAIEGGGGRWRTRVVRDPGVGEGSLLAREIVLAWSGADDGVPARATAD
jgi:hypothetical protein